MQVGGFKEVFTADDVGDSLQGVVVDYGEVVTGSDVFSDNDGVAKEFGPAFLFSVSSVLPGQFLPDFVHCTLEIEAQSVGLTGCNAGFLLVFRQMATSAGVEWSFAAMGGLASAFDFPLDVCSRAEAGVEEAVLFELAGGFPVFVEVLVLNADGFFPLNSEPSEIFEDLLGVL